MEGFRVKPSIRQKLFNAKRRIARRLQPRQWTNQPRPMFSAQNIQYEIAQRTQGLASAGIGAMHLLARRIGLIEMLDRQLQLLKQHKPYHESDHVLNIAYNLLCGGTRLEHLELRRNDEVYAKALGAQRIPDPTTAGDFCRRFSDLDVLQRMQILNRVRQRVWRQQPPEFFDTRVPFFYITNDWEAPPEQMVWEANERCNQENLLGQHKSGMRALDMPVDNLLSNWAYLVLASRAWSLKAWAALLLPETGPAAETKRHEKQRLLRMDFRTFLHAWRQLPCQILRAGGRLIYRFRCWNPWQTAFFRLLDQLRRPLRC